MVLRVTAWNNGLFMPDVLLYLSPQASAAFTEAHADIQVEVVSAPHCITNVHFSAGNSNQ